MSLREDYFDMAVKAFYVREKENEEVYEKLIQIMADYLYNTLNIHFLYRYRRDDSWERDITIFECDKIWLQPMSRQNDTLEFSFDMDYYDPLTPFLALCPSLAPLQMTVDFLQQQVEDYKNKCSIACFSDSYDNEKLWSDYANLGHGYCIAYSALDIVSQFQCFLLPVIYQDKIPTLSQAVAYTGNNSELLPYYAVYKRISTKLMRWSDEREWRVIRTLKSNKGNGKAIQFPRPNAVYLGCEAKESLETDIKKICQQKHIPVYSMRKDDTTGKLHPQQIQG